MKTLDVLYLALAFAKEAAHEDKRFQIEVISELEGAILAEGGTWEDESEDSLEGRK